MTEFPISARLRALRIIAGYKSVEALAEALGSPGLATKTLRSIEQGKRPRTSYRELQELADFFGVPVAWFTADFSRLAEISEEPRDVIRLETAAALARSSVRHGDNGQATRPPHEEDQEQ